MNLLLDTCAVIWMANEDDRFSPEARDAIEKAWFVYVSSVSAWEIGIKSAQGKLRLPQPLETWWPRLLDTHQVTELPLRGIDAIRSTRLPPLHNDPADRMLIATTMENQLTLLTPDPMIRRYPHVQTLW